MSSLLCVSVSAELCDEIAALRRKIQTVGADHVVFLDEVPFQLSEAPSHTIVLPGESAFVEVDDTSSYAPRYDMIAACTHMELFPPTIFSPEERAALGVKGITQKMFIKYIQDVLAQACGALDRYPLYLVLDKASIHNEQKILEAFHDNSSMTTFLAHQNNSNNSSKNSNSKHCTAIGSIMSLNPHASMTILL